MHQTLCWVGTEGFAQGEKRGREGPEARISFPQMVQRDRALIPSRSKKLCIKESPPPEQEENWEKYR